MIYPAFWWLDNIVTAHTELRLKMDSHVL